MTARSGRTVVASWHGSALSRKGALCRARLRGAGLVEALVAVAIVSIAVTALLAALSTGSMAVGRSGERTTAETLARAQMEYTKGLAYLPAPSSYATIPAPGGYSIAAAAASISGRDADIQRVTVTVTGHGSSFVLEDFKMDR
jgi:Tfp pilus assembly protein PilV